MSRKNAIFFAPSLWSCSNLPWTEKQKASADFFSFQSVTSRKAPSDRSRSQNPSSPNMLPFFFLHSVLFLWPLSIPPSPAPPFNCFWNLTRPEPLWRSVSPSCFARSGHKQKSLRAVWVALFPQRGWGHGIHHSLWLSYTSSQCKVKAIIGLSLHLWPPSSPFTSCSPRQQNSTFFAPPWPFFLLPLHSAQVSSMASRLTCAFGFSLLRFLLLMF